MTSIDRTTTLEELVEMNASASTLVHRALPMVRAVCAPCFEESDESEFALNQLSRWRDEFEEVPAVLSASRISKRYQCHIGAINYLISLAKSEWKINRKENVMGLKNMLAIILKEESKTYQEAWDRLDNIYCGR